MPSFAIDSFLLQRACCAALVLIATPGFAAASSSTPAAPALADCAMIGAAADRLVCYDKLAGRAPAPEPPGNAQSALPMSTSRLVGKDEPMPAPAGGAATAGSAATAASAAGKQAAAEAPATTLLGKYWELDGSDKRGVFNFTGYRANYVMPVHATDHINRSPGSPTQEVVNQPNYRNVEAKFQLSLRTKVAQDVGLPGGDVWLAFTQQALWQIWNSADSKPFRNSDYEPEAIYVVPTGEGLRSLPFDWTWRYSQLALAHQSNGQSDPLSRSWNRAYLGAGFERGDFTLVTRIARRLGESRVSDNNPDLVSYRGRADFQLGWSGGLHTASLLVRTTLRNVKYGALQFEWTYPVFREQPNGLRWFLQGFSGYGETLVDYNFRQNSVGLGVSFLQF